MLGGGKTVCGGTDKLCIYFLDKSKNITVEFYEEKILTHLKYDVFTLEEFLEKFPFKINDIVVNDNYSCTGIIIEMRWDSDDRGVKYCVEFENLDTVVWFNHNEIKSNKDELFHEDNKEPLHELCEKLCNNKLSTLMIDSEVCDDEVELILNDYEIEVRDGKTYAIKKKSKYPKTFIEVLDFWHPDRQIEDDYQRYHKKDLIENFQRLLYARDAYWKIAGEEKGLDKPWKQDYNDRCFIIVNNNGNIHHYEYHGNNNVILAFPTEEMRDTFYESFKDLIEICMELL
jgi:hypothetical protein